MSNDSHTEENTMRNVLGILMHISFPYIVIVSTIGICGNFLTIIMLSKKTISKNFNNCTLIALALTDLLFNFMLVCRCINDITKSNSEQLCRLLSFLSHLAELLSACFTAQFTAQRFIAVRFPLSVFIEKKIHLIHYLVVSLFIICGLIYCVSLVQNNAYDGCHEELDLTWFLSDALLSFLIPFTIIAILNVLIINHLKKGFQNNQQFRFTRRKEQSEISPISFRKKPSSPYEFSLNRRFRSKIYENMALSTSKGTILQKQPVDGLVLINERARSLDLLQRPSLIRSKSQSYRVTRMLILVSTCFLVLNAPSHICTIGLKMYSLKHTYSIDKSQEISLHPYDNYESYNHTLSTYLDHNDSLHMTKIQSNQNEVNNDLQHMKLLYLIVIITQHISYASYSINFFLYSFCGIKFRRELLKFMSKQRQQLTTSRSITMQNTI
ncbi:unnamed protein product [Adineta steineri]|uniref:G-protein coupled receptors family 1 profile domain-containing protein n=1 Tax=Adineta steineri TaxID=433720 RepID=A0A818MEY5_9BILA|nr:unnamed protein product [Adineta steineri]